MKQVYNINKNGFSLVELLASLFVFSLAVVVISGVFSSLLKNYATAKKMQRNTESVQYAMNLMAKSLRTSDLSTTSLSGFPIDAYDYSQTKCIRYKYDSVAKKIQMAVAPGVPTGPSDCNYDAAVNFIDLTSASVVSASANVVRSEDGVRTGKISVSIEVEGEPSNTLIQSTLSLRG